MKKFTSLVACLFLGTALFAQNDDLMTLDAHYTSVSLGYGHLGYIGELNDDVVSDRPTTLRPALQIGVEHRFHNSFSVTANGLFGKVSQRGGVLHNYRNFETDLYSFGLGARFHTDNDKIFKKTAWCSPFLSFGVNYFMFDPMADYYDGDGNFYHYWADGTIRGLPESVASSEEPSIIARDYEYETPITDTATEYNKFGIAFPLELGLKFKLGNQVYATVSYTYAFTTTDYIDGYAPESGNDAYHFSSISLQYNFGSKSMAKISAKDYEGVDFAAVGNEDTDGDGVKDMKDECSNTPSGVKVDGNGCPKDSDGDGVADYLDKEPNSASTRVDEDGVVIPEDAEMPQDEKEIDVIKTETESGDGDGQ